MFNKISAIALKVWNGPMWPILISSWAIYIAIMYWAGDIGRWVFPGPGYQPGQTIVSVTLVVVAGLMCAFVLILHKGPQPKRVFKLHGLQLFQQNYSLIIKPYMEQFVFDAIEFTVPARNTTFWIDLEDTDDTVSKDYGADVPCRPKFITTLDNYKQFEQHDLVKVEIDKDGQANVSYLGPRDVTANIKWELSEVIEP